MDNCGAFEDTTKELATAVIHRWPHYKRILATDGVLMGLVVANVVVFVLWKVADNKLMFQNFALQLDNVKSGRFHTMLTNGFSHFEGSHLLLNMISLCVFGNTINETFGPRVLLKLYVAGAFVGSAFCLVFKAFLALSKKEENIGLNKYDPSKTAVHGICIFASDMITLLINYGNLSPLFFNMGGVAVAAIAWARLKKMVF